MASSNADLETRMATLRHEILSYKPGKAVPCDDERVVFPDKLVIGMTDPSCNMYHIDDLRRALHGDVEASKLADKRHPSTMGLMGYLTDSIFIVTENYVDSSLVHHVAGKVGCMVLLIALDNFRIIITWIKMIKEVTGRDPLCALLHDGRNYPEARNELKQLGITSIYEVNRHDRSYSDEEQFQWLDLLHGCLQEGDTALATNDLKNICKNPRCKSLYEETKKEARRKVERLQTEKEEERARAEKKKRSLAAEMTKKLESKQQRGDALTDIVAEKGRIETTLKQHVAELKQLREGDRARFEKEKRSLAAEMTKKLETKQQHVETLTETVGEKELKETTLRQQVEELTKGREEDIARAEKEKGALAADMTKKLESKQQRVDTLIDIVDEKERNETTLKQQVQALKKGREGDRARFEKEKQSIELSWKKELESKEQQLERENWKLRTKIQLESEIRSAEQKKKAETHPWCFIPWGTSGKQAQGTSSFEDNSTGGLERRDTLRAGEEPPDDEFAGILQQIADDLYDEAKIDSLAGQLGILHGDIQRALMTNVKFNRVTSDGTRHMLKQWRRGVSREEERMELRKALRAAQLVNIADLYLSEGDMTSKNQEDLTDGSKSQHPDQSPERSRENLNASDVTSEDVASEEVAGDDMTTINLSSIQPSEQSSSHAMQVLPDDMSPGGKSSMESTILDKSSSLLTCQRPVMMKRPAVGEGRQKRKQTKPSNSFK